MNIGTLDFEIIGKNDGIKRSLEEAKESIKNFTETAKDGGIGAGDAMQAAAAKIEQAWGQLESVGNANREALKGLEAEYTQVGQDAAAAFSKATAAGDKEYRTLTARQQALGKEIRQRKEVLNQVEQLTAELNQEEQAFNKLAAETKKNEGRAASFRAELKRLTMEMAKMGDDAEAAGGIMARTMVENSEEYKQLQIRAGQLSNALDDVNKQIQFMSNDNAGLQSVISIASGVAGAFSVAQGAVGLFAGENENLQKIMVKVQSIMAITMGLQQVANTLNKDSAASLGIFNSARKAFVAEMQRGNAELEKETVNEAKNAATKKANTVATEAQAAAERAAAAGTGAAAGAKKGEAAANNADTKSKIANTVATGGQTVATKLLQRANIMLSASFKAVGAAIKSIPVIGWILAGVSGLAVIIGKLISKSKEAKKEQEEYYKAVAEGAAEPVAKVERLANQWAKLGDNLEAKKKFVDENRAAFEELGIKVNSVEDAENALVKNKSAFVAAQVAKAKATAAMQKATEYYKETLEATLALESAEYGSKDYDDALEKKRESEKKARKMMDEANAAMEEAAKMMNETGIKAAKEFEQGTIGYYEQLIERKRAVLKDLADPKEYAAAQKEIDKWQKQIDRISGSRSTSGSTKDPFKEKLDKQKKQYQEYAKWRNSTDEILQQAAATQFQTLLQQGSNYLDYLRRQRDKLMSEMTGGRGSKKQREQLATLNNAIAEETKSTVLEQFDQELQRQLNGANSLIEKLAIIERKRRELANDGSELDQAQAELLQKQREQVANEIESQYRQAQQNYYDYLESKLTAFEKYQADMAKVYMEYDRVEQVLNNAKAALDKDPGNEALEQQVKELERQLELVAKKRDTLIQQQLTRDAQATDKLVEQYRSAEEKITAIANEHSEKKRVLKEREKVLELDIQEALMNGDTKRAEKLQQELEAVKLALKGIEKDLSKSLTEFFGEEIVGKMLDDAGTLTVEKIDEIIAAVEKKKAELPVDVDTKKFEELLEKLKKLKKETREQQTTIKSIISELQNGNIGEALKQTMVIAEKYGSTVVETYSEVVNLLKQMGAAGDEISQQILSDIGEVAGNAAQLAMDIATQNWGNAVVNGVKLIASSVKLWNDANRENYDTIKNAEKAIADLELAIKKLQNTLARTYSDERYDLQRQIIKDLEKQLEEEKKKLQAIRNDIDGSSSDYTEDDYRAQLSHIEDIEEQIAQAYEALAEDLTQTTIPDIESEITDALINAFANGYSNADIDKEIAKIANKLMKNAAIEMLKTQYLADAVAEWYKAFENAMADGMLDEQEKSNLQADFANATAAFRSQLEALNEMFPDEEDVSGTLSGAYKGASQESIDLLAGYTNATRIIEQSQLDIMTRQLSHIASIDARLEQAVTILAAMSRRTGLVTETVTTADNNTNERAYGIIND